MSGPLKPYRLFVYEDGYHRPGDHLGVRLLRTGEIKATSDAAATAKARGLLDELITDPQAQYIEVWALLDDGARRYVTAVKP